MSEFNSPPLPENKEESERWRMEIHNRQAVDPGDSTATTVAELVADHNTLLANMRTAGLLI